MTLTDWLSDVQRRGGMATWTKQQGTGLNVRTAVFVNPETGVRVYEAAPAELQARDVVTTAIERAQIAAGNAVAVRDAILASTGLSSGVLGAVGKITGIPPFILYGFAGLVVWGMLANAGVVPPLRKVLGQ